MTFIKKLWEILTSAFGAFIKKFKEKILSWE